MEVVDSELFEYNKIMLGGRNIWAKALIWQKYQISKGYQVVVASEEKESCKKSVKIKGSLKSILEPCRGSERAVQVGPSVQIINQIEASVDTRHRNRSVTNPQVCLDTDAVGPSPTSCFAFSPHVLAGGVLASKSLWFNDGR